MEKKEKSRQRLLASVVKKNIRGLGVFVGLEFFYTVDLIRKSQKSSSIANLDAFVEMFMRFMN